MALRLAELMRLERLKVKSKESHTSKTLGRHYFFKSIAALISRNLNFYYRFSNYPLYKELLSSSLSQKQNNKILTMINIDRCVAAHSKNNHANKTFDYIINDTSPTHLLLPYFFSGGTINSDAIINNIIDNHKLNTPDFLIYINVDIDSIFFRLKSRNRTKGKYEALDAHSLKYLHEEYKRAALKIIDIYTKKFSVIALTVNGNNTVEYIANQIFFQLLSKDDRI